MKRQIKITSILCVIAIVCTMLLSSCGNSVKTAISYEDYEIDSNMMKYFLSTQYNDFINQQYSTFSQYSAFLGYITFEEYMTLYVGFNPNKPLDEQEIDDYDKLLYPKDEIEGENIQTWKDYFELKTVKYIKQLLVYRAEAIKLGIALDEKDQKKIDKYIDDLITSIRDSYTPDLSDSKCLEITYGKGVTKKDIRKAMELSAIATKAAEKISDNIENNITNARIEETYNNNKNKFNLVDHLSYSFDVDYDDVIEEVLGEGKSQDNLTVEEYNRVNEQYKKRIDDAHKAAETLATSTTPHEFMARVMLYISNEAINKKLNAAIAELPNIPSLSPEALEYVKVKLISEMIEKVKSGEDNNAELKDAIDSVEKKITYTKTNYVFSEDEKEDAFSAWAFADDRKVNDIKNIENGDGANGVAFNNIHGRFTAEVSMMLKTAYKDESPSYNITYMLFSKEIMALNAITALYTLDSTVGITKDNFSILAEAENNKADAYSYYEDYFIGNMQSEDFDNWLTSAKVGDFTKTPIKMSDNSFLIVYYVDDGDITAWEYDVKSAIYTDDYTAYEERMTEYYSSNIVIHDDIIHTIILGAQKESAIESFFNNIKNKILTILGINKSQTSTVSKWDPSINDNFIIVNPSDPDSTDRYVVVNPNNAYVAEWGVIPSDGTIVNGSANSPSIETEITNPSEDIIIVKPITPSITPEVTIPNEDIIIINPSTPPSIETDIIVVVPKVN